MYKLSYYRFHSLYFHENESLIDVARFANQIAEDNYGAPVEITNVATGEVVVKDDNNFFDNIESILSCDREEIDITKTVPTNNVLQESEEFTVIEDLEGVVVKKKTKRK